MEAENKIINIKFSYNNKYLVFSRIDKILCLLNINEMSITRVIKMNFIATKIIFSNNNKNIACSSYN